MTAHPIRSLLTIAAVLMGWFVLAPVSVGGSLTLAGVDGTSMQPLLHTGDLAVAFRLRSSDYMVGDVAVFDIGGGNFVVHRLHERLPDGSWKTKGDNRDYVDDWTIRTDAILGKYMTFIPGGGTQLQKFRDKPAALGLAAAVLAFLLGLLPERRRDRRSRSTTSDEVVVARLCMWSGSASIAASIFRLIRLGFPPDRMTLYVGASGVACVAIGLMLLDVAKQSGRATSVIESQTT